MLNYYLSFCHSAIYSGWAVKVEFSSEISIIESSVRRESDQIPSVISNMGVSVVPKGGVVRCKIVYIIISNREELASRNLIISQVICVHHSHTCCGPWVLVSQRFLFFLFNFVEYLLLAVSPTVAVDQAFLCPWLLCGGSIQQEMKRQNPTAPETDGGNRMFK